VTLPIVTFLGMARDLGVMILAHAGFWQRRGRVIISSPHSIGISWAGMLLDFEA
jgi:hypothetical protein